MNCCLMFLQVSNADESAVESLPPFEGISAATQRHFLSLIYYEPGDLISRSDVAEVLDYLEEYGWQLPSRITLEKQVLAEDSFLVRRLRTESGTRFMRKIAGLSGAYDRLDRLSSMSGGRKLINDLIRKKGGEELITYLSTSEGGQNLGKMLGQAKRGSNLNKPTGRIYTVEELLNALAEIHQQQLAALQEPQSQ